MGDNNFPLDVLGLKDVKCFALLLANIKYWDMLEQSIWQGFYLYKKKKTTIALAIIRV